MTRQDAGDATQAAVIGEDGDGHGHRHGDCQIHENGAPVTYRTIIWDRQRAPNA